jgi:pimeloyl-ACP methyl ester carboxylesterase
MPTHTEIKASAVSRDHTEIAYWTSGDGPPIVLVHGTPADQTRWRPLLPYLERQVTVHAIDRRGRGASGDAPEYSLERGGMRTLRRLRTAAGRAVRQRARISTSCPLERASRASLVTNGHRNASARAT